MFIAGLFVGIIVGIILALIGSAIAGHRLSGIISEELGEQGK